MRIEPPTKITSFISEAFSFASANAFLQGPRVFSTRNEVSWSNLARVSVKSKCFGPLASAVMNGRFIFVLVAADKSIFAFSAASFKRCKAILSFFKSMPGLSLRNSSFIQSITTSSKLSPPSIVSPLVASTSNELSKISKMEISKVPPPKS